MIKTIKIYSEEVAAKFNEELTVPGYKITPKEVEVILKYYMLNIETLLQVPNVSLRLGRYIKIDCDLGDVRKYQDKQRKQFAGY